MEHENVWSMIHKAWGINSNKYLIRLMEMKNGEQIWCLPRQKFKNQFPFIPDELVNRLEEIKGKVILSQVDNYLAHEGINLVGYYDQNYPEKLKYINDPPAILYCKGHLVWPELVIAIVGSRKCSAYGKRVAHQLAMGLSGTGVQVVSGLARGIDTAAHQGALEKEGGTLAVLGCGIDVVYPRENQKLFQEVIAHENSGIISELPLKSEPVRYHFPLRNRIISGLADGVVVTEAALKSGALITAELALEQGKDVFAVPGSIFSEQSVGTHKLIKDGAKIVTCLDDILEEYGQLCLFKEEKVQDNTIQLSESEQQLLDCIGAEPISVDELGLLSKLPIGELMAALSWLEINGLIQQIVGRKFMRLG